MQRIRAALDHAQAATKIVRGSIVSAHRVCPRQQAACNGFDGRQRVGKLVAENANQPLPRHLFLFLQRKAHVGQQQHRVGRAVLAKGGLSQ